MLERHGFITGPDHTLIELETVGFRSMGGEVVDMSSFNLPKRLNLVVNLELIASILLIASE